MSGSAAHPVFALRDGSLHCEAVSLEAVARRVGYGSAFALSTAFKRERGISPRQHRRAAVG